MKGRLSVNTRQAERARRLFALMTAVFLALVLLAAAGHAAHHLHEHEPCDHCPVCVHLSALSRSLLEALPLCALMVSALHRGRCRVGRYGQSVWPLLALETTVSRKIKLTI